MELFTSYSFGDLTLRNRMVMASMSRNRAVSGDVPGALAVTYYAQRASAGLIVTEACQVSAQGVGFVRTPGIHSAEQVFAWRSITDAVHRAGGLIFLQLWHAGRVSHPDFLHGELPVAPSAIPIDGQVLTPAGPRPAVRPRALALAEIPGIVEQYRVAAVNARLAGFDGVELNGAYGCLLDQFVRDGSNRRTDAYGGSVLNRIRFALDVADAVADVWGAGRVGYKISPTDRFHSMSDSDPVSTFAFLARGLIARVGYLHVAEPVRGEAGVPRGRLTALLRSVFRGTFIANGGYDAASAHAVIASRSADLVSFGIPFLANPDLPRRFREGAPLNRPDPATFYAGEARGYVDYPFLDDTAAASA